MSNPVNLTKKKEEPKVNPNYKYQRDQDRKLVRGKFIFHEVPGGMLSFSFRKWKEDPVERFDLVDGQIYTLPLGVAKHLNKECKYPIHSYQMDENNKPQMKIGQWVRRCSFQSLEFIDIEDMTPVGNDKPVEIKENSTEVK